MSVTDFFLIAFSWCIPWWLPPYTFPHLHFRVPSWPSLVPILTELYSISYILQSMLKHFRHLTQLLSFAVSSPTSISDLLFFPSWSSNTSQGTESQNLSYNEVCVTAEHLDMDAVHLLHCGPPVVPIPRGLNIRVGLMAVSSKAVEKACRPTGGLPSLSPLHHSTITKGGA